MGALPAPGSRSRFPAPATSGTSRGRKAIEPSQDHHGRLTVADARAVYQLDRSELAHPGELSLGVSTMTPFDPFGSLLERSLASKLRLQLGEADRLARGARGPELERALDLRGDSVLDHPAHPLGDSLF